MKKLALAAVIATAATGAFAKGHTGKNEVIIEAPVIVEEAVEQSSSGGIIVPLVLLLLVAAAAAN